MSPACRPTRGSGLGAVADVLTRGDTELLDIDEEPDIDEVLCVHAAVRRRAMASAGRRRFIEHKS